MSEFYKDIITTLIGVFIGGLLTIWVNLATEKSKIKMEMQLNSLKEIIPALKDYSVGIAQTIVDISKIEDIHNYKSFGLLGNPFTGKLVNVFDNNRYVLSPFRERLKLLVSKQCEADKYWQESIINLKELSEKYNKVSIEELLIYEDVKNIIENTFIRYSEIQEDIPDLINEINKSFLGRIFK